MVKEQVMNKGRESRSSERGATLLETALILPLLLLVMVGIFEFGRAYQTWQVLTNAAREGARVAVLPGVTDAAVESQVDNYLASGRISNPADATVSIDRGVPISIGVANATASAVTVSYPFEFVVLQPVARLVVNGSSVGSALMMAATATMRNE
jgi:Flp pilus assembly protein TadG